MRTATSEANGGESDRFARGAAAVFGLVIAGAVGPACFLDAGAYEGATQTSSSAENSSSPSGGDTGSTTGAGAQGGAGGQNTGAQGGDGGAGAQGGSTTSGGGTTTTTTSTTTTTTTTTTTGCTTGCYTCGAAAAQGTCFDEVVACGSPCNVFSACVVACGSNICDAAYEPCVAKCFTDNNGTKVNTVKCCLHAECGVECGIAACQ